MTAVAIAAFCVQAICAVVQKAAAAGSNLPYVGTAFKLVEALVGLYSSSINATAECKEVSTTKKTTWAGS